MPNTPKPSHKLSLVPPPDQELSPAQKRFNKLLRELETLQARIVRRTQELEQDLKDYALHLAPAEQRKHSTRLRLLSKLGEFWTEPLYLKKGQRAKLRDFILEQQELLPPPADTPLEAAFGQLVHALIEDWRLDNGHGAPNDEALQDEMADLIDPAKLDPALFATMDPTKFTGDMSPREFLEEYKRQAEEMQQEGAETATDKKQKRRAEKAAQLEEEKAEARDKTLSTIYKQLAKVLHPDLERDPKRQTEKLRLMQQVTEAYRARDLFTLLKLEVEHLRKDEGDVATLTVDKLRIYTAVLKEQVEMLKYECDMLVSLPRFHCIETHVRSFYPDRPPWDELAQRALRSTAALDKAYVSLNASPTEIRKELRDILKTYDEALKMRKAHQRSRFY